MFVDQAFQHLLQTRGSHFANLIIKEVRMGPFLAAVELSDGQIGLSAVSGREGMPAVAKPERYFGQFSPLHIEGNSLGQLFSIARTHPFILALKVASLNAITQGLIAKNNFQVIRHTDPFDLVGLTQCKNIVIVGALVTYISKIAEQSLPLTVLELDESALLPQHKQYYAPAGDYAKVLPLADLVIITGMALANDTISGLLQSIGPGVPCVVLGPSAGAAPDWLFQNKVSMVGTTYFHKPELVMPMVSQGATGYHLFEYCAEKITLVHG